MQKAQTTSRAKLLDNAQHLNFDLWSSFQAVDQAVSDLINEFRAELQFERFHRQIYLPAMKSLLLNLYHAHLCDPGRWVMVSLSPRGYLSRGPYNPQGIGLTGVREIVRWMATRDDPYIEFAKGFKFETKLRRSRVQISSILLARCESFGLLPEMLEVNPRAETIRVKNRRGKLVLYKQTRDTNSMRRTLRKLNKCISAARIQIAGFDLSPFGKYQHRVFNSKKRDLGGRFYGGDWQPCPKVVRSTITIDGQHCTELDYSSFHIFLAYALESKQYDGEGYFLNQPGETLPKRWRDLIKKCTNFALNSETARKAIKKIQQQIAYGEFDIEGLDTKLSPKILYKTARGNHAPIAHLFGAGTGLRLQRLDSEIAERILRHFTDRNVVCLGIHDSFIVPAQYEQELGQVMLESYRHVTRGFRIRISKAW